MSAEQSLCTITFRTSGTCERHQRASRRRLCLFSFVPCCLFIIVRSLKTISPSLSLLLFYLLSHIQSCSGFAPPHAHSLLYSTPLSLLRRPLPEDMHFAVFLPVCSTPCLSAYISNCYYFLFIPPFSSLWPPCFSLLCLVSVLCHLPLSFLLTLVKTSPPPRVPTTPEPICYSNS